MTAKLNVDLGVDRNTIDPMRRELAEVDGIPLTLASGDVHRWGMFHLKEDYTDKHDPDHVLCMRGAFEPSVRLFKSEMRRIGSELRSSDQSLSILDEKSYDPYEEASQWGHP